MPQTISYIQLMDLKWMYFFLAKIHELMFYFVVGKIVSHLG